MHGSHFGHDVEARARTARDCHACKLCAITSRVAGDRVRIEACVRRCSEKDIARAVVVEREPDDRLARRQFRRRHGRRQAVLTRLLCKHSAPYMHCHT